MKPVISAKITYPAKLSIFFLDIIFTSMPQQINIKRNKRHIMVML